MLRPVRGMRRRDRKKDERSEEQSFVHGQRKNTGLGRTKLRRGGYGLPLNSPALMSDVNRRVAIIPGAARRLGRSAAERLHERGASVAFNVRDRDRAESLAS